MITVPQALQTLEELKAHRNQIKLAAEIISDYCLEQSTELPAATTALHGTELDLQQQIDKLQDRLTRTALAE